MTGEPARDSGQPEPGPPDFLEAGVPLPSSKVPRLSERPRCRQFNLGDGMILTAALAGWLAYMRYMAVVLLPTAPVREKVFTWDVIQRAWVSWLVLALSSLLVLLSTMTLAFLVMRLRQPRPPLRTTLMQPGMLGCLTVLVLFVVGLLLPGANHPLMPLLFPFTILSVWISAVSWGWLRPEAGWLDRFGRTLGAFWCLSGMFSAFLNWR